MAARGHSHKVNYCGSTSFASSPSDQSPTHPIEDFSLLFFFSLTTPKTQFIFFPPAADGELSIYFYLLTHGTSPSLLSSSPTVHPSVPNSAPPPCRYQCHGFALLRCSLSFPPRTLSLPRSSPPQPPCSKQTHLHVHLDHGGLTRPIAETPVLEPAAERRRWLWFRPLSRQPEGNCCHVPGLTLQLHPLSAEQRSGLESKRLIDLAKALFHNLLTSEMLSYEAKVMEKFS